MITSKTRLHFTADNCSDLLLTEQEVLGTRAPLYVIEDGQEFTENFTELFNPYLQPLTQQNIIRIKLEGNAPRQLQIQTLVAKLKQFRPDGIIVIGGLGVIDCTKFALREYQRQPIGQYREKKSVQNRDESLPMIIIPSSLENGAGLRNIVQIHNHEDIIVQIKDECFTPTSLLCYLDLVGKRPQLNRLCQAADVLSHSIETIANKYYTPPARGLALDAIKRSFAYLSKDSQHDFESDNLTMSRELFAASVNAAFAEGSGLGGAEALALAIESYQAKNNNQILPHGYYHLATLGAILEFNRPAIEGQIKEIAIALGTQETLEDISQALKAVARSHGLPYELWQIKVSRDLQAQIAKLAACDLANQTNPRMIRAEDYQAMLARSTEQTYH